MIKKQLFKFFQYLSWVGDPQNPVDVLDLERYLTPTIFIQSNGEVICCNVQEFANYLSQNQQHFTAVSYSPFIEEPLIEGNRAAIHFLVSCTLLTGEVQQLSAMAILTFDGERISRCVEILH